MKKAPKNLKAFDSLLQVMSTLAAPDGCPWDKEQTHKTLIPYLIEESYEFIDAIESNDKPGMADELGDLLLQIVFHAELAKKNGDFDISDVIYSINDKMIRRHPHVFSNVKADTADDVKRNWDIIKAGEKKSKGKPKDKNLGGPLGAPALQRSHKIGEKTRRLKFDWPDHKGVVEKLDEEVSELKSSIKKKDRSEIEHEIGDVLFTIAQLARHFKLDPESCLRTANRRFESRFFALQALATKKKLKWEKLSDREKENLWQEIKRKNLKQG